MSYAVAVGGATGNVGAKMLEILEERNFPISQLVPLASAESVRKNRTIQFRNQDIQVQDLEQFDFSNTDILFLSTGAENSRAISPIATAAGCWVIDNSSAFRMHEDVPLIVPEINSELLDDLVGKNPIILPVANCSTIQLVMALKPLHEFANIQRVVVSSYQSASGGGRKLLDRLTQETNAANGDTQQLQQLAKSATLSPQDKPIAYNVIPHIDVFMQDGRTKEEWKLEVETQKILSDYALQVSACCVRVPIFVTHAEAVNVQFEKPITAKQAKDMLANFPGVIVVDDRRVGGYATPLDVQGRDEVFVSRIREDKSVAHGLSMWIVADNIRKGAALNAVQIAEALVERKLISTPPRRANRQVAASTRQTIL